MLWTFLLLAIRQMIIHKNHLYQDDTNEVSAEVY